MAASRFSGEYRGYMARMAETRSYNSRGVDIDAPDGGLDRSVG
jgi:hypothetical protein